MTKWRVEGVDKSTNEARSIDVFAEDGAAAHAQAEAAGIHVITVRAVAETTDSAQPSSKAAIASSSSRLRSPHEALLRKSVLWWATVTRIVSSIAIAAALLSAFGEHGGLVVAVLLATVGTIGFTLAAACELLANSRD